jgi:radical SAM protein with 4Fe4S-binding SPASM domain
MATLEITTMVGCPVMCTFCPQDSLRTAHGENDKYLTLENFKVILNKVPSHVRIDFSGMSEPWAAPDCTQMLEYTFQRGYEVAIYTTLYGIKPLEAPLLIDLLKKYKHKLSALVIHTQDKNNNMKGLKFTPQWVDVANQFIDLFNSNEIPFMRFMTMDENGEPHEFLSELRGLIPKFNAITRAGSLPLEQIQDQNINITPLRKDRIKCGATDHYDHNILLPNGDVLLCCMDYGKKHIIGNLLSDNYADLFYSNPLNDLRAENMNFKDPKCSICRVCHVAVPAI